MKPKGIMRRRIVRKSKKRIKTRHKVVSISKLIKTADKLFSDAVRQIGANKEGLQVCYTCGHKNHWKKLQCSHFLSRYYKSARWDFDNARPTCFMCNIWKKGDLVNFRQKLLKEIGQKRVEVVEAKRHQSTKLTRAFLEEKLQELLSRPQE